MDKSILNWGPISLTRRNHGLEHATLNLLARKQPGAFAGHSDQKGFWIIGDVSTDLLLATVREALERMNAGERSLSIHQNCGTNFVTTGLVAGSMAWLFTLGKANSFKKKINRWSTLVMVTSIAAVLAYPLGFKMQEKVSVSGEPGNLVIRQIMRYERPGPVMHRVFTGDQNPGAAESV